MRAMIRLRGFFSVLLSFAIGVIETKFKSLLAGVCFEGLFMVQLFKVTL
jgi:hypothetical protein